MRVVRGSLLDQKVEAIVNAANTAMRGGGGIDGAIHAAAGPGLLKELRQVAPRGCSAGQVVMTSAYDLPFSAIIHTPGPVWRGGGAGEAEVLASCYRSALEAAAKRVFVSIGFCSISTGIYGYPLDQASHVAIGTVVRYLEDVEPGPLREIIFSMFGEKEFESYSVELSACR